MLLQHCNMLSKLLAVIISMKSQQLQCLLYVAVTIERSSHKPAALETVKLVRCPVIKLSRSKKRSHEDVSPLPLAKRRRLAKSPDVPPAVVPSSPPSRKQSRSSLQKGLPHLSPGSPSACVLEKTQPMALMSPKRKSVATPVCAEAASPVKSSRSSLSKETAATKSSLSARKQSAELSGRLSSGRKRSSPGGTRSRGSARNQLSSGRQSAGASSKRSSTGRTRKSSDRQVRRKSTLSPQKQSPAAKCSAKQQLRLTPGSSDRRLTFSKSKQTPSPGPSKEELKASVLAELNVRVSSKLPEAPAAGSKIPRFFSGNSWAAGGKRRTRYKSLCKTHNFCTHT